MFGPFLKFIVGGNSESACTTTEVEIKIEGCMVTCPSTLYFDWSFITMPGHYYLFKKNLN